MVEEGLDWIGLDVKAVGVPVPVPVQGVALQLYCGYYSILYNTVLAVFVVVYEQYNSGHDVLSTSTPHQSTNGRHCNNIIL